jgi:hypothetical protein
MIAIKTPAQLRDILCSGIVTGTFRALIENSARVQKAANRKISNFLHPFSKYKSRAKGTQIIHGLITYVILFYANLS